jgi:hypothetical protein
MNILNSQKHARLAAAGSLFSLTALLAACGGGSVQDEPYRAVAKELAQGLSAADSVDVAVNESDDTVAVPPAAWETEDDPVEAATFLAREQALAATGTTPSAAELVTDVYA